MQHCRRQTTFLTPCDDSCVGGGASTSISGPAGSIRKKWMVVFIFSVDSIRVRCMQFPVCCFHQRGNTPQVRERRAGRRLDGQAANSFSTSALTLQRSVNARECSNVSGARTISALAIRALAEHVAPERSSGQRVRVAPQKKLDSGRLAMENFWTLPDTWRDSILRRASKLLAI
jgi:hypothetical protein